MVKRPGSNDVGAVVELVEATEVGGVVKHREGSAGLDRDYAGDLPAAKHLAIHAVVPT